MAEEVKLVVQVATPDPLRVWDPQPLIVEEPFLNATVPVGVTPEPETVAVRVVDVPTVEGEGLAVRVVVLVPAFTVSRA